MKGKAHSIITKAVFVLLLAFVSVFAQAQKAKPQKFTFVKKVIGSNSPNLGKTITIEGTLIGKIIHSGLYETEVLVFAQDKGKEVLVTNLTMLPALAKDGINVDPKKPKNLYTVTHASVPKGLGENLEFRPLGNGTHTMAINVDSDALITTESITIYEGMSGKNTARQTSVVVGGFKSDADFESFKAMFK